MREPIAIVGLACTFPGSESADAFWHNIINRRQMITEAPAHRCPPLYYDPQQDRVDRFYANRGGFIDEYARFDPLRFGVMPLAASGAEPDQLIALQVASDALADAGYHRREPPRARTEVILGRGGYIGPGMSTLNLHIRTTEQLLLSLDELVGLSDEQRARVRQAFVSQLGRYEADTAIGLVPHLSAARIANRLNLGGGAFTIDAACASALIAVERACESLHNHRSDLVLAGGIHLVHDVTFWSVFSQLGALSRRQEILPFSRLADGLLIGEGVGMVTLKRLADAERDRDRVYAVIKGVGSSSDGSGGSLMSPDVRGQTRALRVAWADLDPADIGLIEAHGTGTPAGDEAELKTLIEVFGPFDDSRSGPLRPGLGSVKSMIGHTMPAAGIAGLIKATLAVHHGILPPTLYGEAPHPLVESTAFRLIDEAELWPPELPRSVGINAFGFGGVNAHVVIAPPPHTHSPKVYRPLLAHLSAPHRLWLLAEESAEALRARLLTLKDLLERGDLSPSTPKVGAGRHRVAFLTPSIDAIHKALKALDSGRSLSGRSGVWLRSEGRLYPTEQTPNPQLVFMCPGIEASFQPKIDDLCARLGLPTPHLPLADDLGAHGVSVIRLALTLDRILKIFGLSPDQYIGHSIGEWTGLIASGSLSEDVLEPFISSLSDTDLEIPEVAFLAVGAGQERAELLLAELEGVVCSHDNCPHQSLFCLHPDRVEEALKRLAEGKVMAQILPFKSGFHAPYFQPYAHSITQYLTRFHFEQPHTPLWSATTCAPYPLETAELIDLSGRHLVERVRFRELTEALYARGARVFIQLGLGSLSSFVSDTLRGRSHVSVEAHSERRGGYDQCLHLLATLFVEGASLDLSALPSLCPPRSELPLSLGVPLIQLPQEMRGYLRPEPSPSPSLSSATSSDKDAHLEPFPSIERPARPMPSAPLASLSTSPPILKPKDVGTHIGYATCPSPLFPISNADSTSTIHYEGEWEISLEHAPYLIDHCFFQQPQGWPVIEDRFPVVPMTLSIQWLMEVAQQVSPATERVVGIERVRAIKWLEVEPKHRVIVSCKRAVPFQVDLMIEGHISARALTAPHPLTPPQLTWAPLKDEVETPLTAEDIYRDRWMFHGASYQAIEQLVGISPTGIRGLIRNIGTPGALLDNVGQLFGLWVMLTCDHDKVVMPIRIDRILTYGPPPPINALLSCAVWIDRVERREVRARMCLWLDGQVWATIEGWRDWRFETPPRLWHLMKTPEETLYGDLLFTQTLKPLGIHLIWTEGVSPVASSREFLIGRCLTRTERKLYRERPPLSQQDWLAGRIAAKDAIRSLLWDEGAALIFPIEVEIERAEPGVRCLIDSVAQDLSLSIAHKGEVAVSIASRRAHIGVDMERVEERDEQWAQVSFSADDFRTIGEATALNLTIAWCLKEARVKAESGRLGSPRHWYIDDFSPESQTAMVSGWPARWLLHQGYVIAICYAP
jgi:acyl transferase domain-containing protein